MIQNLLASALLLLPIQPLNLPDIQAQVAETLEAAKTKETPVAAVPPPPSPQPPPPAPKPVQATTAPQTPAGGVLACIRRYESRGNYRAVSPSGKYLGAYQADRRTWNGVWRRHGRPDLVGKNPALQTIADQDQFALYLYRERGLQPWPTPSRKCR